LTMGFSKIDSGAEAFNAPGSVRRHLSLIKHLYRYKTASFGWQNLRSILLS
jgi:hypothetical protein